MAHRLGEQHALFRSQLELLGSADLIAIVEPGRQSLRGREQVNVRSDEARAHVIVRLLDLRIVDMGVRLSFLDVSR